MRRALWILYWSVLGVGFVALTRAWSGLFAPRVDVEPNPDPDGGVSEPASAPTEDPAPGRKWIKGYTRADGRRVEGYWRQL